MIILREFQESDIEPLVQYMNMLEITQFITDALPSPYNISDAQWWIKYCHGNELIKAIEYQGKLVGCISAQVGEFEYHRSAELGYWVAQQHWNKGIASQAVQEFSQRLLEKTNIVRVFVSVVSYNGASIKVLQKNGYQLDGILKQASFKDGQYFDEHLMSKIKPITT